MAYIPEEHSMNALQSLLTPITHHIPFFLRQPAEAIIGKHCYDTLIYDLNITDGDCLKYALSKGLGLGIVVGGGIVKIPQILKIVNTRSARGLSLSAYVLETISYAVNLAYSSRNKFPFSTYGENFFLTVQNVIITLLIIFYSTPRGAFTGGIGSNKPVYAQERSNAVKVVVAGIVTGLTSIFLWSDSLCPLSLLGVLQAATLPISLLSKAPQIISNHRAKSTGNLSAFAIFNALLGCVARLFTTKQEVNDPLIFWGFAGAAALNLVLAGQMVAYWQNGESSLSRRRPTEDGLMETLGSGKTAGDLGGQGGLGKRWERKLD